MTDFQDQTQAQNLTSTSSDSEGRIQPTSNDLTLPRLDTSPTENLGNFSNGKPGTLDLSALYDIPVQVSAVLGRSTMQVNQLLKLGRGAVIELDRKVGEAVDVYVNNRLVARGEVVVVGEHLGITMTEIIKTDRL